jgi:AcrR family transcriptional regulator
MKLVGPTEDVGSGSPAADGRARYHSPLRAAQAAATRARILEAMADVIEQGQDATYAAIAAAADVQERTVYRHFPTKDELYAAFWQHVHEHRIRSSFSATDRASLLDLVAQSFRGFDRNPELVRAMLHSQQGLAVRLAPNDERQRMFAAVIATERPELGPEEQRRAAAAAQVLYSATAWEYLREYWQMDVDEIIATVQQALTAMLAGLGAGAPPPTT